MRRRGAGGGSGGGGSGDGAVASFYARTREDACRQDPADDAMSQSPSSSYSSPEKHSSEKDGGNGQQRQRRRHPSSSEAAAPSLQIWCLRARTAFAGCLRWVVSRARKWAEVLHLQLPAPEDLDQLNACVDCGAEFSMLQLWRQQCPQCQNIFCGSCLSMQHSLFDGTAGQRSRSVCSFCFFQLCARHCEAKCCAGLPIKSLKRFLGRKGISMRGAVEKSDLVASVHAWAKELALLEESGALDFEAV